MKPVFVLAILVLVACNNGSTLSEKTDIATKQADTDVRNSLVNTSADSALANTDAETENRPLVRPILTRLPKGIYQVALPSTKLTIHFHTDQTFISEEKDKDEKNINYTTGTWKPTEGVIWTYKDQIAQNRYTWKGDKLAYLDPKTQKTYPMQKLSSILDNNVWRNKGKEGAEFFGVGNEPFWSIEIDEQKAVNFQLADWSAPVQNADSLVYQLASDSANVKVVILNQFCNDGMSDNIYDNKVKVTYNNQTYNGCGILYK